MLLCHQCGNEILDAKTTRRTICTPCRVANNQERMRKRNRCRRKYKVQQHRATRFTVLGGYEAQPYIGSCLSKTELLFGYAQDWVAEGWRLERNGKQFVIKDGAVLEVSQ